MKKFDIVVLSGGGTKAIGQLGVLHFYHEKGLLDFDYVTEYRGTSAGSIISVLLICGYLPIEILKEVYGLTNFFKPSSGTPSIWDTLKNVGLMSIQPAFEVVEKMIVKKMGKIPTLRELYFSTKKRLVITAANISKMRMEYYTPERNPHLRCTDASKMSSSLPIIFHRLKYKGDYIIDGGLGDNFPIEGIPSNKKVLGVTVIGTEQPSSEEDMSFLNFIYRVILFPINRMTYILSKDLEPNFTLISLVFDDAPVMDLSMESSKKMEIFMKGYTEAQREFKKERIMVFGWDFLQCEREKDGWDVDLNDIKWDDVG